MTKKLYYEDNHLQEFTATIVDIQKEKNGYRVELDKTLFYPEGGGQPADKGYINSIEVVDVQKEGDQIFHYTKKKPLENTITGTIDWHHRFDYMQQHTGQHILSGALKQVCDANTVSVYLGSEYTAIEVDMESLSEEQIMAVENRANEAIRANYSISALWSDAQNIEKYNLRRETKHRENIRVLKIGDYDTAACGGVHCSYSKDVGVIVYIGSEKIRGHIRTLWKIGNRLLKDYHKKTALIDNLKRVLSAKEETILSLTEKLQEQNESLRKETIELQWSLAATMEESLLTNKTICHSNIKLLTMSFDNVNNSVLSRLMKNLTKHSLLAFCFIVDDGKKKRWYAGCSSDCDLDFPEMKKRLLPYIKGNGGGRAPLWQGVAQDLENREAFFCQFATILSPISSK